MGKELNRKSKNSTKKLLKLAWHHFFTKSHGSKSTLEVSKACTSNKVNAPLPY